MSVGVTMFFDLKSLPDSSSQSRPMEFYVKNGEVTLSQDVPMVIFCDSSTRAWIEPMRTKLSTAPTVYVEKSLSEYEHYKLNYEIVKNNRKNNAAYKDSRNTISYCLTTTLKFHAIKIASEIYPEASHYFWLDFGCAHIAAEAATYLPLALKDPNPKVSCAYIHYRPHSEVSRMEHYLAHGNPCGVGATIFSVAREYVAPFYTRTLSIFYEMLSKGVGHNEEAVLTYLYDRFPEMFHLYYGDYTSSITNYKFIHRDYHAIRHFYIQNCINNGKTDNLKECAHAVLQSIKKRTLELPKSEILFILSLYI